MAKLFSISGFKTVLRIDRVNAVDRVNEDGKEFIRVFLPGVDSGYHFNFEDRADLADKYYDEIIKALIEEVKQ